MEARLDSSLHGEYDWLENVRTAGMSRTKMKVEEHPDRGIELAVSKQLFDDHTFAEVVDEVREFLDDVERQLPPRMTA